MQYKLILLSPVHSKVIASDIFMYGSASDPLSPSHESLAEIVTPKGITNPQNNPPNWATNVPDNLDSDPSSSDYSPSDQSD